MTDVGYVGGGYTDEVGQARSVCFNHINLFIKFKVIPPKEKPPSNTPTAFGSGGTRTPATSLGNAGGGSSATIKFKMRVVSQCQCITRTPDQPLEDFYPQNDLLDFEESGFKSNEIDKECDADGFREMRVNISEVVGLCAENESELGGDLENQEQLRFSCKCNLQMNCEFEADASKFVTDPKFADGGPLRGPLLDDLGEARNLTDNCTASCQTRWLETAKELWINPFAPGCSDCLVKNGLGCASNAEAVRLVMNASKMKEVPGIVQTYAFNQCMSPDCPKEGEETSLDRACDFIKLFMKG